MTSWLRRRLLREINHHYKRLRRAMLSCRAQWLKNLFFRLTLGLERAVFMARRETPLEAATRKIWKQLYFARFGTAPNISVETEYPIAYKSDDHRYPRGTIQDNSSNPYFNAKLYRMLDWRPEISLLDLGCAGGGLVRSVIEDGHVAVGIEGSDLSRRLRSREWDTCPFHLFTADITRPFCVKRADGERIRFDVCTAWEVLEHIPAERLDGLLVNIRDHLKPGGYFIGSVCLLPDENPLIPAVYHVSLYPREWWLERFAKFGFTEVRNHEFEVEDYVRGNAMGIGDWDPRRGDGFHLVLRAS